jgi:transposase
MFMQDNAPVHKSASVIQYLRNEKIATLDRPPQSPDLYPIENIEGLLKSKVSRMPNFPKNRKELVKRFKKSWEDLEQSLFAKLSSSVPKG